MTWTRITHKNGPNETRHDAPGRGGYRSVYVESEAAIAIEWWRQTYETDPTRFEGEPGYYSGEPAWTVAEFEDPKTAREAAGTKEIEEGAIGVPKTRPYTWNELRGLLHIRVVTADEVEGIEVPER